MINSAKRLTYRDALRLAPVAWLDGEMVTIEGACDCSNCMTGATNAVTVRFVAGWCDRVDRSDLKRPNPAARKLMEALR